MNFNNYRLKKKPEFMIIPMIDIIFFLLVFFMMNSLQTVAQKALAVQLPRAQTTTAPAAVPDAREKARRIQQFLAQQGYRLDVDGRFGAQTRRAADDYLQHGSGIVLDGGATADDYYRELFGLPPERIEVVVHPQSIVHSMVQFADGAVMAQLGTPDMHLPIAYALAYPHRLRSAAPRLDFAQLSTLTFEAPDRERFRNLDYAYEAARRGGNMPCILNAADEVAVAAFLRALAAGSDPVWIVDDADELADRVTRRDSALLATADELAEASRRAASGGLD